MIGFDKQKELVEERYPSMDYSLTLHLLCRKSIRNICHIDSLKEIGEDIYAQFEDEGLINAFLIVVNLVIKDCTTLRGKNTQNKYRNNLFKSWGSISNWYKDERVEITKIERKLMNKSMHKVPVPEAVPNYAFNYSPMMVPFYYYPTVPYMMYSPPVPLEEENVDTGPRDSVVNKYRYGPYRR